MEFTRIVLVGFGLVLGNLVWMYFTGSAKETVIVSGLERAVDRSYFQLVALLVIWLLSFNPD